MTTLLQWAELRPVRWLMLVVWMVFFTILLLQSEKNPIINTGIPPGPQTLERDMLFTSLHLLGFVITTTLWWRALSGYMPSAQAVLLAVVIAVLLSFTTEWLQSFTPDRYPQVTDLLANAAGAALVFGYEKWLAKRQTHRLIPG